MDIHKNARLSLRRREDLVEYVYRGVAQPYSNTAQDPSLVAVHGWAAVISPSYVHWATN
jgi:hypothetical protein